MLQYTTGDIIKRAQELADLQNSDFISWSENMHLLDESYKKLYQECINANDKYYLTSCTPSDLFVVDRKEKEVRYELPEDFYQLHSIIINRTATPLMKKALTESSSSQRYDIINNCIVIYGGAESMDLTVNYYPVPKTLTLKAPEVEIEHSTLPEGDIVDVNGTKLLFHTVGAYHKFTVYDITTGRTITFTDSSLSYDLGFEFAILGKTSILVQLHNKKVQLRFNEEVIYLDSYIFAKKDNYAYIIKVENHNCTIIREDYAWRTEFDNIIDNASKYGDYVPWTFSEDNCLYAPDVNGNEQYFKLYILEAPLISNYVGYSSMWPYISAGKLFYGNNEVKYGDDTIVESGDFASVIGVNKIDYNTGYGISVTSYDDENIHIKSCFNDTVLDFPNNFYFNFLAYQLAIAYKAKQGADYTALNQLATEEAAQFFNSLSRDTAENCRIQNVYGGLY